MGALCVIDRVPRQLTPEQREALARLGRQVVARLELRLTNRRLTEQAGFQQAILNSAAAATIATTSEGIITHFSPAAEQMLGYTAAEVIGKLTPAVFHDPAEVAARAPELSRELGMAIAPGFEVLMAKARAGQTETREWTYVRKDGSRLPVLLSVSAMRDDAGRISGFIGIARELPARPAVNPAVAERPPTDRRSVWREVAIGVLGFVSVVLVFLSLFADTRSRETSQAGRTGMDALGRDLALSHLWLEEAIMGDTTIQVNRQVLGKIDASAAMLRQLRANWVTQDAQLDAEALAVLPELERKLAAWRELTVSRWANRTTQLAGSPEDQAYDALFDEMQLLRDRFSSQLVQAQARHDAFDAGLNIVIVLLLTASSLLVVQLFRRNRQQAQTIQAELEQAVLERTAVLSSEIMTRRAIKDELQGRQAQLRDLFDNSSDLIQSLAPDGRILFVNHAWRETLGYSPEEVGALNLFNLIHPDSREHCTAVFRRLMQGEAVGTVSLMLVSKDGRRIELEGNVSVRVEGGQPVSTRGIFRDVTVRKAVEVERDRFFTLSLDLLCIAKTDGYFKRVNPAFTVTLGWSAEELLARPFLDFVHPDDRAATVREVEKLAAGQPTLNFENRYQCRDGSWKMIAWQCQPQPDGTLYASGRNVTEMKRARDLESARATVLERLANAASLREVFDVLIRHVERIYPGHPASILLLDAAGRLQNVASTGLPDFYNAAIEGLAIGPGVGSCGDAAATKQRSVAEDIETHPNWQPYLELARRAGLRACWSQPMLGDDGQVLGTFAIYSPKPEAPGETDLRLLEEVARLAAMALQQRQAEEALRASEASLAVTLRSIGDAVLATDAQRRITRMNPTAEKLTGWPEAEALGRPLEEVFRIINEDTRQPALIPVDDVLATGEVHGPANHAVLLARDGPEFAIADSAAPIRDQGGHITGVVLCFRDETKERRARREDLRRTKQTITYQNTLLTLRDHEGDALPAFLRLATASIAQALPTERVSVWFFDPAQTAIECHDLFIRSTQNHERGLRLAAVDYPRYFEAIGNQESMLADDARTHPATSEFTTGYLDPQGITSMLDVPIRVGGKLVGVLCCEHTGPARQWTADEHKFVLSAAGYLMLALEQADRRKAEEALRESEERHRLLVHGSRDAMMTLQPPTWKFTSCNPAALTLFGVQSEAEFCTLGPWDLSAAVQPDGRASAIIAQEAIARAMEEGALFFEWLHQRLDGTCFPATVQLNRLEQNGAPFLQATVRDIALQKQAEALQKDHTIALERRVSERTAALAESERFNTATLNALTAHVAVLDKDGVILTTNSAWRDFAETNGTAWQRVSEGVNYLHVCAAATGEHATEAQLVAAGIREVIAGSRAEFTLEYPCHSAGERRWFLCRVTRFPGEGPVRVVLAHEDITAIKQAQQRAEQTQRQFHDLFEFAPDAIVMTDATGTITLVNRQAEQLFGYARGELVGQLVELLMPESNRHGHVAQRERYLTTATPRTMSAGRSNLKGRKKDGTVFPVEISLSPMESASGRLVVAAVRDITEPVQAEQQMRQALATLDATEDAAFIFDPETLRFSYVNEGAVRQLGYTRAELLTMGPVDIKPQFTEAQLRALLDPLARGEDGKHQFTTQHRRKDGRDVPVEISLKYVAPPGERPRFIAIVRDITERLAAEKKDRRSQRLESIGTLAGGVAHDLNNTLAPILMVVEILRLQYPEQAGECIDIVEQGAKRGADMVRQLLTFAKGAEGERVLLQLRHQLKDIEKIIRSTFDKSIHLEIRQDKQLAPIVGDATQIHQILLNLCVNARDAMPGGGTLTIEAGNFTADEAFAGFVAEAHPGQYVRVAVRDTGTGIPPEILDRIFDPFFTTKGPEKGTGLGLSTVVGIVKGHGGFLRVYSEVGRGSTFEIYLPVTEEAPAHVEAVTAVAPLSHGELVLVVDDEAPIREMLGRLLKTLGFTVITAADGSEALIHFGEHRADLKLIITDVNMPTMDGVALARTVKRLAPTTPIIAMSGLQDENRLATLRELGVIHQLAKPFSLDSLNEALRKVFTGGRVEKR